MTKLTISRRAHAGVAQWPGHQPSKLGMRVRFPSPAPEDLSTKESQPWFFHFKKVEGIEPMRWISVKKTCQWHVFRKSPEQSAIARVQICAANLESRHPLQENY